MKKQRCSSNEPWCTLPGKLGGAGAGNQEESAEENEKTANKVGKPRAYCVLEAKEFLEGWSDPLWQMALINKAG